MLDRLIFWLLFGVVPCLQLPFFENPSLHPKQLASLLAVPLMLLSLAARPIVVPRSLIFWIGVSLGVAAVAMSFVFGPNQVSSWSLWLESLFGVIAFLYFFRDFSLEIDECKMTTPLLVGALVNLVVVGYQMIVTDSADSGPVRQFAGLFGENNLLSQFFVVAIVAIGTRLHRITVRNREAVVVVILQTMLIAYIVLFQSRSVFLGLSLWVVTSWFLKLKSTQFRWLSVASIAGGLAMGLVLQKLFVLSAKSASSVAIRADLYVDTLLMLLENPFGVGRDQFQFAILPYSSLARSTALRGELFSDPHSELLSFAVDYGIVLGALVVFIFVGSVWSLRSRQLFERHPLALGILICLVPDLLFQFPLHVYPTRLILLSAFAALAVELWGSCEVALRKTGRGLAWTTALGSAFGVVVLIFANVSGVRGAQDGDISGVSRACRLNPWDWRICDLAVDGFMRQRDWGRAKDLALQQSKIRPLNEMNRQRLDLIEFNLEKDDDRIGR